jgi:hypothetical protein
MLTTTINDKEIVINNEFYGEILRGQKRGEMC